MTDAQASSPPDRLPQSRTARLARKRLERLLDGAGSDVALWRKVQARVPEAWATLEDDIDCAEPKVKISLRVDTSVARLFRAMGKGYQERINRVLATYAQMKIGEVAREKALEAEVDNYLRGHMPKELGEAYAELRAALGGEEQPDLESLDEFFGWKR